MKESGTSKTALVALTRDQQHRAKSQLYSHTAAKNKYCAFMNLTLDQYITQERIANVHLEIKQNKRLSHMARKELILTRKL